MKRSPRAKRPTAGRPSRPVWLYVRWGLLLSAVLVVVRAVPAIMRTVMPEPLTWAWVKGTAYGASLLITAAGIPCTLADGNLLFLTNHVFRIDPDCTGGLWYLMYAFAVLLMPVSRHRKFLGLLVGLPVLAAFNFLRLVLVAAVSEYWPAQFHLIHDIVMQSAFLVVTTLVWAAWLWWSRNDRKPSWG